MSINEKISNALELPKDLSMNYPKMTVMGKSELCVENFRGVVEFNEGLIRLNTTTHILKISGNGLYMKNITIDDVEICGDIKSISFE